MAEDDAVPTAGNAYTRFFDWLDRKLTPAFGPPNVTAGSDGEPPVPLTERACPLCGHPMGEHYIDHSTENTVLECPTGERLPLRADDEPLNEVGMPASRERLAKLAGRR